jgi:ribose/xylose/arabinose/galactoside ABC-type transport system permease subunit
VTDRADASEPTARARQSGSDATSAALTGWLRSINPLVIALVVLCAVLGLASERFLTVDNLVNIARASSVALIVAVGQTFVITSRNIDLSVGSMMALIMALTGTLVLETDAPWFVAIPFAMALGAGLGLFNGFVVTVLKVPALLATLGTLVFFRGVVQEYMYGSYHVRFPADIVYLGQGRIDVVPIPVIIAGGVALVGGVLLGQTRFGRYTTAIGGSREASERAGIRVDRWVALVFVFQGLLVGLAGIVLMGRLDAAQPTVGTGLELAVIAGVVLGGTSLFGGRGLIGGTILGVLLIGVLENGLLLAGAGFFWQQIMLGLLIIGAVSFQMWRQRRNGAQRA